MEDVDLDCFQDPDFASTSTFEQSTLNANSRDTSTPLFASWDNTHVSQIHNQNTMCNAEKLTWSFEAETDDNSHGDSLPFELQGQGQLFLPCATQFMPQEDISDIIHITFHSNEVISS